MPDRSPGTPTTRHAPVRCALDDELIETQRFWREGMCMLNTARLGHADLETIYAYGASYAVLGADQVTCDRIQREGWAVVNAPRPLSGSGHWTGEMRHGSFYAAGDQETFGRGWAKDDAWPVRLVEPAEVISAIKAFLDQRNLDSANRSDASLRQLVQDLGWPPLPDVGPLR